MIVTLVVALTIIYAIIEIYLIIDLIKLAKQYATLTFTPFIVQFLIKFVIVGFLAIGPFGYGYKIFKQLITKEYFLTEPIIENHLKDYFHRRFMTLRSEGKIKNTHSIEKLENELARHILTFLERTLRESVGINHYELSIFSNKDHPEIICYFDSNNNVTPRSCNERKTDPDYYKRKRYEVVELLSSPVNKLIIIGKTSHPDAHYSFVDEQQKRFIKSSCLYCFDSGTPRAIVITCDKEEAFQESNQKINTLIIAAGSAMLGEYELQKIFA